MSKYCCNSEFTKDRLISKVSYGNLNYLMECAKESFELIQKDPELTSLFSISKSNWNLSCKILEIDDDLDIPYQDLILLFIDKVLRHR